MFFLIFSFLCRALAISSAFERTLIYRIVSYRIKQHEASRGPSVIAEPILIL